MASSIINRNIKKLGDKFLSQVNYVDVDYRGQSPAGETTITAGAVLVNNLKLWLISTQGDYYRRKSYGGFLDNIHEYPLNDAGATDLKSNLLKAIVNQFTTIEVIALTITPNIEQKAWLIQLVIRDTVTGIVAAFDSLLEASLE